MKAYGFDKSTFQVVFFICDLITEIFEFMSRSTLKRGPIESLYNQSITLMSQLVSIAVWYWYMYI